jgi:hypothetical protein
MSAGAVVAFPRKRRAKSTPREVPAEVVDLASRREPPASLLGEALTEVINRRDRLPEILAMLRAM